MADKGGVTPGQAESGRSTIRAMGGALNYAVSSFWLFIGWAGWAIALGGLAALQHYTNDSGSERIWAIEANYPELSSPKIFRLDWFILFAQMVVMFLVTVIVATNILHVTRAVAIGYLASVAVLNVISTDRMYNISHFHISSSTFSSSRCAFAGFLLSATADYCLIYMLGISPEAV